jgi:hypothetical protein
VFMEYYAYEVKHVTLHSTQNPTVDLRQALLDLERLGFDDAGNLIVLVFAGHAEVSTDKNTGRTSLRVGYVPSHPVPFISRWDLV